MSLEAVGAEVAHQQSIRRELTHRAAVAEVFVTSLAERGAGRFVAGAQLPRMHAYFGDHLGALAARHDPLVVMETARQTAIAITHEFYGVPLDSAFTVRTFNGDCADDPVWACGPDPTDLVLAVEVPRTHSRGGVPAGLEMILEIFRDDSPLMTVDGSFSWTSPQRWTRARAAIRGERGLPAAPGAPVAGGRAAAAVVARENPRNVIVDEPVYQADSVCVRLSPDPAHPFLFDHRLDHLPGSLLLEAARQTALTLLIPRSPVLPQLIGVTSRFDRFVELDRPAYCEAVLSVVAADQAAVRCVIRQEGGAAAELELAFLGDWQAL